MQSTSPIANQREAVRWFPMRVTYGREVLIKEYLDTDAVDSFLPMREEYYADAKGRPRKRNVPAVRNLIFIHSSQKDITEMKMYKAHYQPLRYMTDRTVEGHIARILTIPDQQMDQFIRVATAADKQATVHEWSDFFDKPGDRVRITGGDFKGVEGVIRRIKRNKHVVVELKGIAVAILTFVPPAWIEKIEG